MSTPDHNPQTAGATPSAHVTAPTGGAFLVERQDAATVLIPEAFDDDLKMFATTARTFVQREIVPDFAKLEGLDYELSREKMAKAGELGLLAVEVPEVYGGLGAGKAAASVVTEAVAASGSFNVTFNAHVGIGTLPLVYFGTEEQKARYLPKLATGEWVAAYCLTEPGSGSDSLAAKARADLDGDEWVLNGTKMWISNAGFADLFTVFAQVDGDKFSCFLVEKGAPGLSLGAEEHKMGIKGSSTRQVILENVRVPKGNLLGEVGKGHRIAFGILNIGRFKLAVGAAGGAKQLIGLAQAYAKERQQFKAPIATFGLIQEKIGRMAADTYALESAVYRLAGSMDAATAGKPDPTAQLAALNDYAVEYSFIKVFGSEILDYVVDEALQVYGGYGFSADYPIELAYRNSRINRIFEGTNEINRELTVDQLLKRAMRGELDLLGPAQAAMLGRPVEKVAAPEAQADAELALANLKLGTLMVAGMGAMAYMQGLEREQELLARVADMVGLAYLAEAALLRAERLAGARGGEVALLLARLYTFAAVDRARDLGTEALRRIPRGEETLPRFHAYLAEHGVDLVELRRQAAQAVYAADGYPLG
ncbi:MAG: acyl-CoA dehydrogenase family protein [Trueperaceae bacterium]|nr:acyl-CoA dehydrogenase family protein [Trueperaceae bacterium]MCW5819554.1 acyl-CoA dehydrogenase family protein [Trueperaceae bacterium]